MRVRDRAEYHVVLLDHLDPTPSEWRRAGIGTGVVHLALLAALLGIPQDTSEPVKPERPPVVTRLFDPPARLTQKAPNRAPVTPQISVAPQVEAPRPKPEPKRFTPPPAPAKQAKAQRAPAPTPAVPQEPPKIKPTQAPPPAQIANAAPAITPPPPPRAEPPKIVLENLAPPPKPGTGTGLLKVPSGSVQEAVQAIAGGATPRVIQPEGGGPGARPRPNIEAEITSDTNGVDMKPYVQRVLQSVRTNWFAVYPESARLGLKGQVVVQFEIAPDGTISKTVFMAQSRSVALDRAAISALSMSDPLPPLPPGLQGKRVVLQFTFSYNTAR